MKSKEFLMENVYDNKSKFELGWSITLSILSIMLSICCYITSLDEWFLLLGALSGSSLFALIKVWRELKKQVE